MVKGTIVKAGELSTPGFVRTISGQLVNLINVNPDELHIEDIAWNLGKIIRYNGAIRQDHTVAHHCVIMSYYVSEKRAMEALLHDAGEAYVGDVVHPIKALFPEFEAFENRITAHIVRKFGKGIRTYGYALLKGDNRPDLREYRKSPEVDKADVTLFQHECFSFGNRPGIYNPQMQIAWETAIKFWEDWWLSPNYLYLQRYHQLAGTEMDWDEVEKTWFPDTNVTEEETNSDG